MLHTKVSKFAWKYIFCHTVYYKWNDGNKVYFLFLNWMHFIGGGMFLTHSSIETCCFCVLLFMFISPLLMMIRHLQKKQMPNKQVLSRELRDMAKAFAESVEGARRARELVRQWSMVRTTKWWARQLIGQRTGSLVELQGRFRIKAIFAG